MVQKQSQLITHKAWTPADVERLSGLSPVALRDLRRRGLAPDSEQRKMSLSAAAQLFLQSKLVAHGFGPKSVKPLAEAFADDVVRHAMEMKASWIDEASYKIWLDSPLRQNNARYLVVVANEKEGRLIESLSELSGLTYPVVTLVDLKALGDELSRHLADRPSSARSTISQAKPA
jgi:hypothetical protein